MEAATSAFGIDAICLNDRMRLFSFATSENRLEYLWGLRSVDQARSLPGEHLGAEPGRVHQPRALSAASTRWLPCRVLRPPSTC